MKKLIILSLLIAFNGFAQNSYTLEKKARVFDISGGEFLTAVMKNDTAFIKHYDVTGNLIWEDFLLFIPDTLTPYIDNIVQFKNTDECVINIFSQTTNTGNYFTNRTQFHQFTKLNLADHTFSATLIDTFECGGLRMIEWRDTSMFLIVNDYFSGSAPYQQATYSLNSSLVKRLVAPRDSMVTNPTYCTFYAYDDTIYKYLTVEDYHSITKYTADVSLIQTDQKHISTSQDYSSCFYRQPINSDSAFIFTQGHTNGYALTTRWKMNWIDLNLNTIHQKEITAPLGANSSNQYEVSGSDVEVDKVNKRIYILGTDQPFHYLTGNNLQKIFVFDYEFNLICEIPVNIGNDNLNSLLPLNNLVYLKVDDGNTIFLQLLNCNMLSIEDLTLDTEHRVYPNPTNSNVSISNSENKQLTIELMTLNGQEIMKISKQENLINIDVKELPSGIYLIRISDGATTQVQRIMKE